MRENLSLKFKISVINYNGDADIIEAVDTFKDFISGETLATEIIYNEDIANKIDLNGHEANIITKKA